MKKYIVLLCLFSLIFSCKKEDKLPQDILSKELMRDILIRIHIAEGKVSLLNMKEDSAKVLYDSLTKDIYKHYKTDSATFKKSYSYYTLNPKKLDGIYASVVDSLSLREARKIVD